MKNLINFLVRYSVVFLFIILEVISLVLISRNKGYQRSILLSSTNTVVGKMYETSDKVIQFFKLSEANKNLAEENTQLKNQVTELENMLDALTDSSTTDWTRVSISPEKQYDFISAKVIRITTHQVQNYITLNKGSLDNIKPDMGVIGDQGVVGIVEAVSPHFSKVIPILHPKSTIITKFKKSNYYGPLVWDGLDYRYAKLNDISRHVKFSLGDTLITSGFKAFPEGIVVGTINNFDIKESDAYYNIQVKLAVDFRSLTHVKVINYENYQEQRELEEGIQKDNTTKQKQTSPVKKETPAKQDTTQGKKP